MPNKEVIFELLKNYTLIVMNVLNIFLAPTI
jgi:hypothetical protein